MPDLYESWEQEETVTIPTPGQSNGADLQIGPPRGVGMGKSGRRRRTIPRVHQEMPDKYADGTRQGYPPTEG